MLTSNAAMPIRTRTSSSSVSCSSKLPDVEATYFIDPLRRVVEKVDNVPDNHETRGDTKVDGSFKAEKSTGRLVLAGCSLEASREAVVVGTLRVVLPGVL